MDQTQLDGRTRTFSWADPSTVATHLGKLSGLELLQAIIAGELPQPPVMDLVGIERLEAEEGQVKVYMPAQEFHYNPLGSVHGGILATLLDTATGCAVHSILPANTGYTSLDLNVKFIRPATIDSGELVVVGSVLSRGRTTALAEARMTGPSGKLIAHATSSCLIFDMPPDGDT